MKQMKRRVVVTGMGTYNPLGNDVETTWENAVAGRSGIGPITHFDASEYKTQIAGEVRDFDPVALFGRKEARRTSRLIQLALAASNQALVDAGLEVTEANRDRVGTILGSGMGALDPVVENANILNEQGPRRVNPFLVPQILASSPAAYVSIMHGLRGPHMSIAGGTEASILPLVIAGFSVTNVLSTRNDAPQAACRPFDKDRDGFVASEGVAVLVLEELEHAQARGALIYGEFLGYGTSADAYHLSMPAENGAGAVMAMRMALEDAELDPEAIGYINAHGTSTLLNDKSETAAIKTVFGERAYDIPVSSTKSVHGHLLGAAGALEAVLCLKALQTGLLPPTINYETPDPECDLDYVPNVARKAAVGAVLSNGFGMGGHNATIILGKYEG